MLLCPAESACWILLTVLLLITGCCWTEAFCEAEIPAMPEPCNLAVGCSAGPEPFAAGWTAAVVLSAAVDRQRACGLLALSAAAGNAGAVVVVGLLFDAAETVEL